MRPVGILLVVPVLIEVLAGPAEPVPDAGRRGRPGWRPPPVAPVAGTAVYLGWVRAQFGDAWLPFRVQQQNGHRGAVTLPFAAMGTTSSRSPTATTWAVPSTSRGCCCAWSSLVVAFRRLPLSYAAFAAAVLVVSLASSNLDSFERYALGRLSRWSIAASTLTSRRAGGGGGAGRCRRGHGRLRHAGLPRGGGAVGPPVRQGSPAGGTDRLTFGRGPVAAPTRRSVPARRRQVR